MSVKSLKQHKIEMTARRIVSLAISAGMLKRKPCLICGKGKLTKAHHEDYMKPLEVIFLCDSHHQQIHKKGVKK